MSPSLKARLMWRLQKYLGGGGVRRASPRRFPLEDREPGLFLVGRGVTFDKCICGCGGVGVSKKLRTAVSIYVQVTWRWEGACLYLFLMIVCRVFACPSVLAGQAWWRSRHTKHSSDARGAPNNRPAETRWTQTSPGVRGEDYENQSVDYFTEVKL